MSLSDRAGNASWRPSHALLSQFLKREFVSTAPDLPSAAVFIGESDIPGVPGVMISGVVESQPENAGLGPDPVSMLLHASEDSVVATQVESPPDEAQHPDAAASVPEIDLESLRLFAHQQGFTEGQALLREELAREHDQALSLLRSLIESLRTSLCNADQLHVPLRRLALHIAELLVRGELQVSGQVIDRLVQHCIDALTEPADRIVVWLNPEDAERLRAIGEQATSGLQIEHDPQLLPGSLRLQSGETLVEDLVESRLEAVASRLLGDLQAWRLNSPLLNPRTAEPSFNVGTGHPRWAGQVIDAVDAEPVEQKRAIEADDGG